MDTPAAWKTTLESLLATFGGQTGTIHRANDRETILSLVSQVGVPESLMGKISQIPFGKGIAGAAAESREPVELCNLQKDLGGVAREGARATGVAGSLAVPIFAADSNKVVGTLGIGKFVPYEFSAEEKARLAQVAVDLAPRLAQSAG